MPASQPRGDEHLRQIRNTERRYRGQFGRQRPARSSLRSARRPGCSPRTGDFVCGADACPTRGALLAQESVAFRTVVTTGASSLRIRMPATTPPWLRDHDSRRRLSRPVTARQSRSTRSRGLVRSAGFGQAPICRQAWSMGFPGWSDEMACLHKSQGAAPLEGVAAGFVPTTLPFVSPRLMVLQPSGRHPLLETQSGPKHGQYDRRRRLKET